MRSEGRWQLGGPENVLKVMEKIIKKYYRITQECGVSPGVTLGDAGGPRGLAGCFKALLGAFYHFFGPKTSIFGDFGPFLGGISARRESRGCGQRKNKLIFFKTGEKIVYFAFFTLLERRGSALTHQKVISGTQRVTQGSTFGNPLHARVKELS